MNQMKIQQFSSEFGWVFVMRVGPTLSDAERMLAGYRRRYPRDTYRLVEVDEKGQTSATHQCEPPVCDVCGEMIDIIDGCRCCWKDDDD
jgi:hypothetical protein